KLSGADPITLTGSNTAKLSIGGLQQGTYLFELDVTDNKGAMGTDLVTVQVNAPERRPVVNQAPFADAGNDTSVQISDNGVLLNGSGSYDPDGQIFSYSWNQESGPNVANIETAESVTTPISNLIPGNYVFQLTVTDDQGAIDTASVRIVVGNNLRYLEQIVLYPNPAHDLVHFRLTSDIRGMVKINVYDLSGKIVRSMQMHKDQNILDNSINVADFSAGMYTIQFIIGDNGRFTSKLIKQ
ncbi:MAG TPA: T9SS type A sorting domain-containing protein, partial [Puia sp.]|nr:T9SS type A sorting domain-containing protein [Puia sp.]